MSTEEQIKSQNKIEESNNNNNIQNKDQSNEPYKIISQKPFPYNIREWYPDIELEKILEKIPNTQKLPHLSWENRSKKILEELKTLNGDLISITEIENDSNFMRELNNVGYELAFKPRTGKHSEGCALVWKEEKFEMLDLLSISFNMNKDGNDNNGVYSRDNIALIGIFKIKNKDNMIILFATTQLIFNVKRGDIKLGQCYQIVNALEELRKKYEDELKNKVYIIFASDLNCVPKSGVYKLLTQWTRYG